MEHRSQDLPASLTPSAPRTLRASGPGDLLALVPALLGFHPEESLVLVTVGAARAPVHARIDLPRTVEERADVAEHLTAVAGRSGVRRAAVVAYGRDPQRCTVGGAALADGLLDGGVEVVCALRADGRRWWLLGDGGPGVAYDLATHPLTTRAVVDGAVVLPSRRALERSLVGDDPVEVERVRTLLPAGPSGPCGPAETAWLVARVQRFLADGCRLDTGELVRVLAAVADDDARDAALADISAAVVDRHVDLWRDVVRRSPPEVRAQPAALLAFAAWLSGDGALAWCAVESAREVEPAHRLVTIVARALDAAVPPSVWT